MAKNIRARLVARLAREKANWIIGGHENAVADGAADEMPTQQQLEKQVYDEVIAADRVETAGGMQMLDKDIRFLGKDVIRALITSAVTEALNE